MSANEKNSVTIVCPGVPVSANVRLRKYRNPHAYARYRDAWQRTLWALLTTKDKAWLLAMAQAKKKMRIEATLLHSRLYDQDNAYSSLKPILDSLTRLSYLAGDDPAHLELSVKQTKIRANELWLNIREA